MSYARVAAGYINAWCALKFVLTNGQGRDGASMASTMANGSMIDAFDHQGGGSHKYIPADRLTADLGEPAGAGVFGYWRMKDGSYLLRTCRGPLAWWSGGKEEHAEWGDFSGVEARTKETA
jgi:hypothetical protein